MDVVWGGMYLFPFHSICAFRDSNHPWLAILQTQRDSCFWLSIFLQSESIEYPSSAEVRSPLPDLRTRLAFISRDCVQHDFVHRLRRIEGVAFAPIVADRVCEHGSRAIEVRAADRAPDLRVSLQAMFGILVPEVECSVGTGGAECAVLRVEADSVDAIYIADVSGIGWCLSVAFETEVRARIFFFDVLDRAAAFDAADCEAGCICETGHDARLPFEGGLESFVEYSWFVEVDDVDVAVCGADDEHLVAGIDAVDSFLTLDRGDGVGRP